MNVEDLEVWNLLTMSEEELLGDLQLVNKKSIYINIDPARQRVLFDDIKSKFFKIECRDGTTRIFPKIIK